VEEQTVRTKATLVLIALLAPAALAAGGPVTTTETFAYDAAGRLVEARLERDAERLELAYTYDQATNLVERQVTAQAEIFSDGFESGDTSGWAVP
jgi:hypothetical protein